MTIRGKSALIDPTGKLLIEPKFELFVGHVNDACNCIPARQRNSWGIWSLDGRWKVKPQYASAGIISSGYLPVEDGNTFKFIDTDGKLLVGSFEAADSFAEGLASVKSNGKWGFIDTTGKLVIPTEYDEAGYFSQGLAGVRKDGRKVYIKSDGSTALTLPPGLNSGDFSNDRAIVWTTEKQGVIDRTGTFVVQLQYKDIQPYSDGMAAFEVGLDWGYLDVNGIVSIEPIYEEAEDFSCGLAAVKIKGKYGYIDKQGKLVIDAKYDDAGPFVGGVASVDLGDESFFIDKTGQVIEAMKVRTR